MVKVERWIDVPPEQVFDVLSDAPTYHRWVVGAKDIRGADPSWPQPGAHLNHTVGVGPFRLNDNTEVLEVEAVHRLVLEARGRPFGRARIEFQLAPTSSGTAVSIHEVITSPRLLRLLNPLLEPLVRLRNKRTLGRLSRTVADRRSI